MPKPNGLETCVISVEANMGSRINAIQDQIMKMSIQNTGGYFDHQGNFQGKAVSPFTDDQSVADGPFGMGFERQANFTKQSFHDPNNTKAYDSLKNTPLDPRESPQRPMRP